MTLRVSVIVATCGSDEWAELAQSWALPSAEGQGADELIVLHEPDATVAEVRNHAAEQATGDLIAWCDGDDQWCDGYLDAMRAAIHQANLWRRHDLVNDPCMFVPALGLVDPDNICLTTPSVPDWKRWPDLNVCCIGTLLPREMFLQHGGFHEWETYEDYDNALRLVSAGARLVPVPEAVYCATRNPNGRNLAPLAVRQSTYEAIRGRYDMAAIPRNAPLP